MIAFDPNLTLISSATAVARPNADGALTAALLRGRPGVGKSTLALEMIGLGAVLISDDVVGLGEGGPTGVQVWGPNPPLAGLIETRGIGLLRCPSEASAALKLVVDLPEVPTSGGERLAGPLTVTLLNHEYPLVRLAGLAGAAGALYCLLGDAELVDPDQV